MLAWWNKLLGRSPAERHRGLFDTPPRRTPEEQAVLDDKQSKLLRADGSLAQTRQASRR
jgi:hypothetical protein